MVSEQVLEEYRTAYDVMTSAQNDMDRIGEQIRRETAEEHDALANVDVAASRVENLTMKLLGIPPSVSSTVTVNTGAAESALSRLEARR